jgi:ABC-type glycerol-3-phosphate transport system substrate-binding protein
LFYNTNLIPTAPETWTDWETAISGISGTKAAIESVGGGGYLSWYFSAFLANSGGKLVNEGRTAAAFAGSEGRAAAQMMQKLYLKSPSDIRDGTNAFGLGNAMFKLGSSSDIDNLTAGFPNLKFNVAKMPYDAGAVGNSYSNIGGENLVIFNHSPKKASDAMKLIEFLTTEANMAKIARWTGNFAAIERFASSGTDGRTKAKKAVVLEQLATAQARPGIAGWITVNDDYLATSLDTILRTGTLMSLEDIGAKLAEAETAANALLFR